MSRMNFIIPQPVSVEDGNGSFTLTSQTAISTCPEMQSAAEFLASRLRKSTALPLVILPSQTAASQADVIKFSVAGKGEIHDHGYRLSVRADGILIEACDLDGAFNACQTLRQLMPDAVENSSPVRNIRWEIQAVRIMDNPRFRWRGAMLDSARGYHEVATIREFVDLLAMYKMNCFHWHLTDDQGWRIEIKKYPLLTKGYSGQPARGENRKPRYYTQQEIRELVEYARVRNVTIIPEIEMPGHSVAAVSAYPEMNCSGTSVPLPTEGGNYPHVFCPGHEPVYGFIADILGEIAELFPSPYLHIGGDECVKSHWQDCPRCQKAIRENGLGDVKGLEHYFVGRVAKIVKQLGRRMIGWDEILEVSSDGVGHEVDVRYPRNASESPVESDVLIQSWRDPKGIASAARLGHDVIASTVYSAYISQSPRQLPLRAMYSFEPVPSSLRPDEAARIIGIETCLWGDTSRKEKRETLLLPRFCAMAEAAWTEPGRKNFESFRKKILDHRRRWARMGLQSDGLDDVEITYEHPDVKGHSIGDFTLVFRATSTAAEPAKLQGCIIDSSGIGMTPETVNLTVDPDTTVTAKAVFHSDKGWDLNCPLPFNIRWKASFEGRETIPIEQTWIMSVAPERRLSCPPAKHPINIDGSLNAWEGNLPFVVSAKSGHSADSGQDGFCRFGVCHDDAYVYFAAHVRKKEIHSQIDRNPWQQDGIEIRFDARDEMSRFHSDGEFEFRDLIAIAMSPGDGPERHGSFYRKNQLPPGIRAVCLPVSDGFVAEVAVPAVWFERWQPGGWRQFRLNVAINCHDGTAVRTLHWRPPWRAAESFPWSGTFHKA